MNITKPTEKLSAAAEIDAVALRPSTAFPANGQAKKPQPQRRWLAAIFTAFALLLAAGGAQAQATVSSITAPNGLYKLGAIVPITVTFDETVVVTGVPTMNIRLGFGFGSASGIALYTAGSGSTRLTFTYTVRDGDNATMLDYNGIFPIILSGEAAIRTGNFAGMPADLQAPPTTGSISDTTDPIIVDGIAPDDPSFDDPAAIVGSDNIINAAERDIGPTLTVNTATDVFSVRLCIGGTPGNLNAKIPSCSDGTSGNASETFSDIYHLQDLALWPVYGSHRPRI